MLKATFLISALFLCTVVITAENYQMTSTSSPKMLRSLKNFSLIEDNHLDFLSGRPATLGDIRSQMNPALEKGHGSVSDRVGVNFSVALQQNKMNPSQAASLLKQHFPKPLSVIKYSKMNKKKSDLWSIGLLSMF